MVSTLAYASGSGLTTLSAVGLYMLLTGKPSPPLSPRPFLLSTLSLVEFSHTLLVSLALHRQWRSIRHRGISHRDLALRMGDDRYRSLHRSQRSRCWMGDLHHWCQHPWCRCQSSPNYHQEPRLVSVPLPSFPLSFLETHADSFGVGGIGSSSAKS